MRIVLKIIIVFLNVIFSAIKLLPVKNKVTFISRQSDEKTEDFKLLELSLKKEAPDIQLVFLCRMFEGNFVRKLNYFFHFFKQMYHIATSKVVVLDSYCIGVSVLRQRKTLTVIQMWHAMGALKKFGLSIIGEKEGRNKSIADVMAMHKNYTWVLTSGRKCVPFFSEAFGYPPDSIRVMSLPRVDNICDESYKEKVTSEIFDSYPNLRNKKIVVYAPTFRKGKNISSEIDNLAACFDSSEYAFIVKKHPLMNEKCKIAIEDTKFSTLEMLFASDYVICDYSAVAFEAAILKKPLFFYTFDYESYGVDRDFYIDFKAEMPGIISPDPKIIAKSVQEEKFNLTDVQKFADAYIENRIGCSQKLAQFVMSFCNKK